MIKVATLMLVACCWQVSLAKSNGSVGGTVLSETGEVISYATLMLNRSADSSLFKAGVSELDGSFQFANVPDGSYILQISYVGFTEYYSDVINLRNGEKVSLPAIELGEKTEELDEIVVKAARQLVEVHPDKTVFNVEGSINAAGNDAMELLRKAPGVVVDNNDNILLQGKSGVKIYIDGKPSPLSTSDLANYLKTMQSTEIDAIEIISNPGARYEAEGNAGIVNIRLKKDKSLGTNGSLNLGYRQGQASRYNASTNFNHRNKGLNIFGSYSFYTGEGRNDFNLYREQSGMTYDQGNNNVYDNTSHNFRLGTDFFLSEKSTIGFLVNGNISNWESQSQSRTNIAPIDGQIQEILQASNDGLGDRDNLNFNVNYAYKGEDATLNFDFDYGRYRNDGNSYQPNTYFDPSEQNVISQRIFSTITPTDIDIYTAKFDYEKSALGGKLGIGAKLSLVQTDNSYDFFDVVDGSEILNLDRSNNFVYEENVNAGYLTWQASYNDKWTLSAGLRMEHTHSKGDLTSAIAIDDKVVERDYVDVFPSGGVALQVSEKHNLRLNYSRRIDRPSYQDLNPFEDKLDELTFQKGNPFLNPQYSNNYSFTHTYNYRLTSTLSYTNTKDVFTQITDKLDERSAILTYVNLAKQTNTSLSIAYPFTINKWWSAYSTMTAYRLHNEADIDGKIIDLNANVLSLYAQNTFLLPKGIKLELSGWYNSPALWQGNWTTTSQYDVSAGIQKRIWQDRANVKISVSDIFLTNHWSGESRFGDLFMTGNGKWDSRQVRINFSYSLGNDQVKSARRRSTGMEDEQRRVKSGNN
ncbi:MAG: TonB-dependent receptor [Saprospiraceae bacterium]|nr:TonB-dependent receptor [Saprospiraceae bacterium]